MQGIGYKLRPEDREELLLPVEGRFDPVELEDCPAPVRRYLLHSIRSGTDRYRSIRVEMTGQIKLGRWLPFRAQEVLSPHRGCGRARVEGLIVRSDSYVRTSRRERRSCFGDARNEQTIPEQHENDLYRRNSSPPGPLVRVKDGTRQHWAVRDDPPPC